MDFNFRLETNKDLKNISIEVGDKIYKAPKVHQKIDTFYNLQLNPVTTYRLRVSSRDTTFYIKDFNYRDQPNLFMQLAVEVDKEITVTDEYFELFMNL